MLSPLLLLFVAAGCCEVGLNSMMCPAGGSGEAASPGAVLPVQERGPSSSWIKVLAWLQFLLGVTQEWESGSFLPQQQQVGSRWGREPPLGQFTPCHSQCTLSEHIGCVSVSIRNSHPWNQCCSSYCCLWPGNTALTNCCTHQRMLFSSTKQPLFLSML